MRRTLAGAAALCTLAGAAALCTLALLAAAPAAQASFGFVPGKAGFSAALVADSSGSPAPVPTTTAGSHPYQLDLSVGLNTVADWGGQSGPFPDGDLRDLRIDTPPGLVIDPAAVNLDSPTWPKPLPTIAGGTALGGMLMVVFVLMQQMLRRGVEDPVDIELLGLPVYASIPFSEKGRELAANNGRYNHGGHQRLLALKAPTDLAMEALRSLRTSLHFARFKTKNNMLMITAPSPGVGKTFVCANLAVTMAQALAVPVYWVSL